MIFKIRFMLQKIYYHIFTYVFYVIPSKKTAKLEIVDKILAKLLQFNLFCSIFVESKA